MQKTKNSTLKEKVLNHILSQKDGAFHSDMAEKFKVSPIDITKVCSELRKEKRIRIADYDE